MSGNSFCKELQRNEWKPLISQPRISFPRHGLLSSSPFIRPWLLPSFSSPARISYRLFVPSAHEAFPSGVLIPYAAADRQDLSADPPQPFRGIAQFTYVVSDHLITFHTYAPPLLSISSFSVSKPLYYSFLLFPTIALKAASAVDTKRVGSSAGAQTRLSGT